MNTGNTKRANARVWLAAALAILCGALFATAGQAAIFIKFDGVDGESMHDGFERWNVVDDISWLITATSGDGGTGTMRPRVNFGDFNWNQEIDSSYPHLFSAIARGTTFRNVKIAFFRSFGRPEGDVTYFEMLFENVGLTSLELTGDSSSRAQFRGAFNYQQISATYHGPDGRIEASYDVFNSTGQAAGVAAAFALGLSGPGAATLVPLPAAAYPLSPALLALRKFPRNTA